MFYATELGIAKNLKKNYLNTIDTIGEVRSELDRMAHILHTVENTNHPILMKYKAELIEKCNWVMREFIKPEKAVGNLEKVEGFNAGQFEEIAKKLGYWAVYLNSLPSQQDLEPDEYEIPESVKALAGKREKKRIRKTKQGYEWKGEIPEKIKGLIEEWGKEKQEIEQESYEDVYDEIAAGYLRDKLKKSGVTQLIEDAVKLAKNEGSSNYYLEKTPKLVQDEIKEYFREIAGIRSTLQDIKIFNREEWDVIENEFMSELEMLHKRIDYMLSLSRQLIPRKVLDKGFEVPGIGDYIENYNSSLDDLADLSKIMVAEYERFYSINPEKTVEILGKKPRVDFRNCASFVQELDRAVYEIGDPKKLSDALIPCEEQLIYHMGLKPLTAEEAGELIGNDPEWVLNALGDKKLIQGDPHEIALTSTGRDVWAIVCNKRNRMLMGVCQKD